MRAGTHFLDHATLPWLLAAALLTCLPHSLHHPLWISLAGAACLGYRAWLWHQGLSLPRRAYKLALVIIAAGSIFLQYRTLFGREAGVALLFLLVALKLLELRTRRDADALLYLCLFLLLAYFLLDQSLLAGLWLLLALIVILAALACAHGRPARQPGPPLRLAGKLVLQAIPFMLVLYLFFPRLGAPMWGLNKEDASARTGLSEQMAPGGISHLAENREIAFRVKFAGSLPPRSQLYWRGPVLDDFDGTTWRPTPYRGKRPQVDYAGTAISYDMTLEPHQQRWLLALDAPSHLPSQAFITSKLMALASDPVIERQILGFTAHLQYRFNRQEDDTVLQLNRRLPALSDPESRALAQQWRATAVRPDDVIRAALDYFREQDFTYTLNPPRLGQQATDNFLFRSRQGFCEHYAGAFTVLMRAAGLPARVVTGYQGGEINPVDGYLVVRQSDAHAWSEVWLEDQGWVRIDPTAAVSPSRIEAGLTATLPAAEGLPGLIQGNQPWMRHLQHQWEALNNRWNQWVLGYNQQRQHDVMRGLGLEDVHWSRLAGWLISLCSVLLALMGIWHLAQRPRRDAAGRLWAQALGRLARHGLHPRPGETPLALAQRVAKEQPGWGAPFTAVAEAYCEVRYGFSPNDLAGLKAALRAFKNARP